MTGMSRIEKAKFNKIKANQNSKWFCIGPWLSPSIIQIFYLFLVRFEAHRSYNPFFIKKCISIYTGMHIVAVIK